MGPATSPIQRRLEWLALLAMLLLAAFLRLGQPGIVEFKRDEATLSRLALELAQGESFPWLGIGSSVGYPNAPINVYLLAIPYLVSDNPLIATLFIASLNIIAVALLWRMTRRYFSHVAAFVAGMLYAASPWSVLYSRKIWAQDMLAPFVLLTVFTGILGFFEGKRWAQLLHLPLLAITVQIHFGAVSLVPLTLLIMALNWRRVQWIFGAGVLLAVLVSLPYVYGLYDANLLSLDALGNSLDSGNATEAERTREISSTALEHAWFSVAGTDLQALAGAASVEAYLSSVPDYPAVFDILPVALVLTVLVGSIGAWQQRNKLWLVWGVWVVLPIAVFTYSWADPQPHYMIPMLPAAFMLIGAGIAAAMQRFPLGRYVLLGAVLVLVGVQTWVFRDLLEFLDNHQTEGGFGTPLHYQLEARQAVLDANTQRVLVVSTGSTPQFDEGPAVWEVLLNRVPNVDFIAADNLWVQPSEPALLLATNEVSPENLWFSYIRGASVQLAARPGEPRFRLWRSFLVEIPGEWQPLEASYENGVVLTAWQGEAEAIWLRWRLPAGQGNALPIAFVHGLDASGQRVQQIDRSFPAETNWNADDMVYMRVPFELEGLETLRIGLYTLGDTDGTTFNNIPHLDNASRYVDQWVTVPLD